MARGKLIVFEGLDRAGKSTQCQKLVEDLQNDGVKVRHMRFPDRYYYSGCVYSAAKQNPNMSLEWCRNPELGLPRPDLCIFLDISAEDAAKRGGYGAEKYEKKDMQDRVRVLFETLMQRKEGEDFVRIDAGAR
ncbi:Thymidylate kinase [Pyrenophora tritici-repentis]|nr:Thymidylate kinase [Pyrenophora tritici-repentis]PZD28266.1 Tmk, Thymidylate kinase [Pyrenophora tritici-repentis]